MSIEIGTRIYNLRKSKNMTQEQLASEMGVSIAAVSKWETGNSTPDLYMICSIADFFDITTDELLGRTKNKKKVIIADDSEFIRKTLKEILSRNGFDVINDVENGIELLNTLKMKKPDLVILDIKMPEMDGLEALKLIKKDYPDIKVIMCSAMSDREIIDSTIAMGASSFVVKPFFEKVIMAHVERALQIERVS